MTPLLDDPAVELVSVVVPVRNGAALLAQQLDALAAQTYAGAWEVVIADNGSSDGTPELAMRWQDRLPGLRVVDASSGSGANHARNVGASQARGGLLLFCDADDVVYPTWVAAMVAAARHCDAVGGRVDEEALNDRLTQAWTPPLSTDGLPVLPGFLPYTRTANCAVRASVFRALGGFSERYRHGGDDVEFFWRLQLASYRLCYSADAVVKYRHRNGLVPLARQFLDFGRANPLLYRDFAAAGMPPSTILDGLRVWRSLLRSAPRMLVSPRRRGAWVRMAAFQFGLIVGSIEHRVLYV